MNHVAMYRFSHSPGMQDPCKALGTDSCPVLLFQVLTPKQFAKAAVHSYPFFPNANMIANLAASKP